MSAAQGGRSVWCEHALLPDGAAHGIRVVLDGDGRIAAVERAEPDVELFHIGGRRAALRDERAWAGAASSIDDVRTLAKQLAPIVAEDGASARIVVVIENLPEFGDTDAERPLKELMQAINRSEHLLIGEGEVSLMQSGYGLVGELKAGRPNNRKEVTETPSSLL